MVISEQQVNSEVIIEKLVGRFDQNARQEYKWRMDLAINAGYRHIILDVTDVTFIDSAALGWLVITQRKFNRVRGRMSLIVQDGFVRDILNLTEIGEWIPVFRSLEDAVAVSTDEFAEKGKSKNG
ncbi:MAG: STAS domain-containing protein [Nitrospirae bacterium]|nr:STAS domain-containing protein [Nitrospirota bacterium]MDA1303935.1 STAS domain-containing protein [Nitrospirota bacterium]